MPPAATKSNDCKNLHFDPASPQGHVMSVKCEQHLVELTVQVWLLYDHPNFKYCTFFISGTDKRTDDPNTRCPWRTFQAGGKIMAWCERSTHTNVRYNTHRKYESCISHDSFVMTQVKVFVYGQCSYHWGMTIVLLTFVMRSKNSTNVKQVF